MSDDYFAYAGLSPSLVEDFLAGLKKLDTWQVDITLPSHTNQAPLLELKDRVTESYNPYLNPETWHALMAGRIARTEALLAQRRRSK